MRGTEDLTGCGSLFKLKLTLVFQEHPVMWAGTSTLTPVSCAEESFAIGFSGWVSAGTET